MLSQGSLFSDTKASTPSQPHPTFLNSTASSREELSMLLDSSSLPFLKLSNKKRQELIKLINTKSSDMKRLISRGNIAEALEAYNVIKLECTLFHHLILGDATCKSICRNNPSLTKMGLLDYITAEIDPYLNKMPTLSIDSNLLTPETTIEQVTNIPEDVYLAFFPSLIYIIETLTVQAQENKKIEIASMLLRSKLSSHLLNTITPSEPSLSLRSSSLGKRSESKCELNEASPSMSNSSSDDKSEHKFALNITSPSIRSSLSDEKSGNISELNEASPPMSSSLSDEKSKSKSELDESLPSLISSSSDEKSGTISEVNDTSPPLSSSSSDEKSGTISEVNDTSPPLNNSSSDISLTSRLRMRCC